MRLCKWPFSTAAQVCACVIAVLCTLCSAVWTRSFTSLCLGLRRIVVSEHLDGGPQTISNAAWGGVAGGTKYVVRGIVYKVLCCAVLCGR
jgi:hypothetical protein